jgi:hypothetical protein
VADAAKETGSALINERFWQATGIQDAFTRVLAGRSKFEFDVERAVFLRCFTG